MAWYILAMLQYIEETKLTIHLDHNPLRWLMSIRNNTEELLRWILRLYPLEI